MIVNEEDRFAVLAQRRMAIEELAATWVPPLMQKRKKIMKKGSPDGLSFFSYKKETAVQ